MAHAPELVLQPRLMVMGGIPQHPVETIDQSFESLGLSKQIVASIEAIGFQNPTRIQAAVIPVALAGKDVIGLAQTGSGKTAAFVLPLAQRLTHGSGVRGLILSPTREIALQTKAFLDIFGKEHDLNTACLIGGVKMNPQIDALHSKPDIVVATPGRLIDHVNRRNVNLGGVEELVLDEADHMLDLGFLPQIQAILNKLPADRQTMMFSATMPDSIEALARRFMRSPQRIDIMPVGAAAGITHRLYLVSAENKRPALLALLGEELGSTLVFTRRKIDAEWLYHILERKGHPVSRIHSDRSQGRRVEALERFREGEHRILVATDIAGRGIDIPGITHIINFDFPETVEDYIHRAGRTARGKALGIVSSIATWQDIAMVREVEARLGEPIPRCTASGVESWMEGPKVPTRTRRRL
jgi:ATP-dependent RNA helicase RhlE